MTRLTRAKVSFSLFRLFPAIAQYAPHRKRKKVNLDQSSPNRIATDELRPSHVKHRTVPQ
jgi:hypothetical protein